MRCVQMAEVKFSVKVDACVRFDQHSERDAVLPLEKRVRQKPGVATAGSFSFGASNHLPSFCLVVSLLPIVRPSFPILATDTIIAHDGSSSRFQIEHESNMISISEETRMFVPWCRKTKSMPK